MPGRPRKQRERRRDGDVGAWTYDDKPPPKQRAVGRSFYAGRRHTKNWVYSGTIISFDEEEGYGQIKCSELFDQYEDNALFSHKQLKGFKVGDHVQFQIHLGNRGRPVATDLNICGTVPGTYSQSADAGDPEVALADIAVSPSDLLDGFDVDDGRRFHEGTVKLIDGAKGYGFIQCDELFEHFGRDVFAPRNLLDGLLVGDHVRFEMRVSRDGKPQVMDLWPYTPEALPLSSADVFGDTADYPGQHLVHQGIVKKIDAERGFGFVACPELFQVFGSDVFAPQQQLNGFAVGDHVRFIVRVNKRGQPQATELEPCGPQGEDGESLEEMTGTIKSFDPENGYGFISSQEARALFGRDVFLHARQVRHFQPSDHVVFSVRINSQGQPQAHNLREAPPSVAWLAAEDDSPYSSNEEHLGEVKSFNAVHGYGFIECPKLHEVYGRDVFIHQSQAEGLSVGDRVAFRVLVKRGQPQACQVAVLGGRAAASRPTGSGGDELDRQLLRACASARPESVDKMAELLAAGADPNQRDVTGHTALMASALNPRHGERKCRLLIKHGADIRAKHSESLTVLQWARERINPRFAEFLEALASGKEPDYTVALEVPRDTD